MAKPKVNKISDKLGKVNDSFTVYMYDNGFMLEIAGNDHKEDWANSKIVCTSMADLVELIQEATELERS
jgi:hypothetical protein